MSNPFVTYDPRLRAVFASDPSELEPPPEGARLVLGVVVWPGLPAVPPVVVGLAVGPPVTGRVAGVVGRDAAPPLAGREVGAGRAVLPLRAGGAVGRGAGRGALLDDDLDDPAASKNSRKSMRCLDAPSA